MPPYTRDQQISTLNSTTTPLTNGSTFTGKWEQNPFPDVLCSLKTDQAGTLYFDFSPDGVNLDSTFPSSGFSITAGINEFHTAVKGTRFFRIRIVNDSGSDQTYLRCHTEYGSFRQGNLPLNQSVALDADATLVRSTVPQDEIRIGRRAGVEGWTKFGYQTGLTAAGGEEVVWSSTATFTPMTSADTFDIAYNTGTDGLGTTGALELRVYYIDSNGTPSIATHTLSNTGSDTTSFSGLGINRVAVSSSGTANTNGNDITFTETTSGNTQAVVPANGSDTQQCIYFVGSNDRAIVKYLTYRVVKPSGGGNPKVTIKGYVYNRSVDTRYEVYRDFVNTASTIEPRTIIDPIGFALSPTDVLYFVADTDLNNTEIYMRFSLNEYQIT